MRVKPGVADDLLVEIAVEDPRWQDGLDLDDLAEKAVRAGLQVLGMSGPYEVSPVSYTHLTLPTIYSV